MTRHIDIQKITVRSGNLPAALVADRLNDLLRSHDSLVVTAPPGAGKSTLLPLTMLAGGVSEGKILMLEPRRVAARHIASRMSDILEENVGGTVGYRVRFENRVSSDTQIEVLTEGILTRMVVSDPTLDGIGVVVFDEFHERSINSDIALALVRQVQSVLRPDLKIVVMSATIDAEKICEALDAPLVECEGRMFPVNIRYAQDDIDPRDAARTACQAVIEAYKKEEGDILAFLPGQGEIERCREILSASPSLEGATVVPLYGNLTPSEQQRAIAPSKEGERKVVLATPIAETSLTIEGVRTVVDTGLYRKPVFDPRTGLTHLEVTTVSRDMAEQRAGRAGRVAEGTCMRLWTKAAETHMEEHRHAEIEDADLAPMLLSIASFGETDIMSMPWLTLPPRRNMANAHALLVMLGAITDDGVVTPTGKRMAALPCHPRIARMILGAGSARMRALACDIAALLEEKDPMNDSDSSDMSLRLSVLRRLRKNGKPGGWARIAKIAAEYRRMVRVDEDNTDVVPSEVGQLVCFAYPERIAMAIDKIGTYRLSNGKEVRIDAKDDITAHEWIVVASMYDGAGAAGRVFMAAPIDKEDIDESMLICRDNVSWDSRQGRLVAQRECRVGKLLLNSQTIQDIDEEQAVNIICEAMKKDGLSMLAWSDDDVARLQRRVAQVAQWHPELMLPDVSTEHLMQTAAEWLPLYLRDGGKLRTSSAELKKLNLSEMIWNIIPYEQQKEIDEIAPTHIQVPTGSKIRIDYRQGAEVPILSVRLQECFGMDSTPCVDRGRRPLLMELLSPGFKPVQLTSDLASFWQNAYFEVRSELRRRYPKHYWPDNPLEAEAVRGVKRKQ